MASSTPVQGWIEGKSVEIGAALPKLDWRKRGVFRDNTDARNLPPVIDGHDYVQPNPMLIPLLDAVTLSALVARSDSKAPEYMEELARQGIGVNPVTGTTVTQWADKLARAWYGKPYADLNETGGPDPAGDYAKRAQIRAAMATKSWPAWLAMTPAQQQDVQHLSGIGAVAGSVGASAAGSMTAPIAIIAGPLAGAIVAIVAVVIGLVNLILQLAATSTQQKMLENITASPLKLMSSDAVTLCSIATAALNQQYAFARAASAPSEATQAMNVATAKLLGEIERMAPETRMIVYGRCEAVRRDPILGGLFPATAPPVVEDIIVQSQRNLGAQGAPWGLAGLPVLGPVLSAVQTGVRSVVAAIPAPARGPVAVVGGVGLTAALVLWLTRPGRGR